MAHKHSTLSFGKSLKACSFRKHFSYLNMVFLTGTFLLGVSYVTEEKLQALVASSFYQALLFNKRVI